MLRAHTFKALRQKHEEEILELEQELSEIENQQADWNLEAMSFFWLTENTTEMSLGSSKMSLEEKKVWFENQKNRISQLNSRYRILEENRTQAKNSIETLNSAFNMWTFNYPILMAADIIGYDCDIVPVGKDQQQHLEMARDMARYVNHHYWEDILKEPEAIIDSSVAVIPGLDGRKMSKSYNNYISMFESSADLKKKIATIPTDSLGLDDPKNPDTCNVFALIKTFWEKKEVEEIRKKYKAGGYGYWHAKQDLHIILDRFIAPYRESYETLNKLSDEELFEPVRRGNAKMQARLDEVLERMKKYIGV